MLRRALCAPLALLFLSSFVVCNAQKTSSAAATAAGVMAAGEEEEVLVEVAEGAPLVLECPLRVEQRAEWRVDGRPLGKDLRAAEERAGGGGAVLARLEAAAARAAHAGRYTCAPGSRALRLRVLPADHAHRARIHTLAEGAGAEDPEVVFVEIRKPFSLTCDLPNPSALPVAWSKNGTSLDALPELGARFSREEGGARLAVRFFHEDDFGNYSCGGRTWDVRGVPVARAPSDAAVVEGQKLRLTCRVTGKPYPAVRWLYSNDSAPNASDVADVFGSRAALGRSEQGVEGGELTLEAAQRADAGQYWCVAGAEAGAHNASTTVRVKDMYAALWPFLGICLEVFLLCAIILVYEKRRTKPELDDSDTDQHDQKKS